MTEMSTSRKFLAILTLMYMALSCEKESAEKMSAVANDQLNYSFLNSAKASNEANQLRSADYSASFEITKVDRINDILNITVTYPDPCGDSKFEVIWNGLVMESYPEIIFLYIRRTTGCTKSGNPAVRVLSVSLPEKLGDKALAKRVKIILCNTSKKANTENSDISTQVIE
jgi:hypothetical protein